MKAPKKTIEFLPPLYHNPSTTTKRLDESLCNAIEFLHLGRGEWGFLQWAPLRGMEVTTGVWGRHAEGYDPLHTGQVPVFFRRDRFLHEQVHRSDQDGRGCWGRKISS
jgi:hypothetical protein